MQLRSNPFRKLRRWLAFTCLLTSLVLGTAGFASPVLAAPIYFSASADFGFDEDGLSPFGSAGSSGQISAGNIAFGSGFDLLIVEQSVLDVINRPQDSGVTPSFETPYIADVFFEIQNNTGSVLHDVILAFTAVGAYAVPEDRVGLDSDSVEILRYVSGEQEFFLGALRLGRLEPGESATRIVRYFVAGDMPTNSTGGVDLAPIGVTGFQSFSPIPEPMTVWLVGLGLMASAWLRRGTRAGRCGS